MKKLVSIDVQIITEEPDAAVAGVAVAAPGHIRATVGHLVVYSRSSPRDDSLEQALEAIGDELRRIATRGGYV